MDKVNEILDEIQPSTSTSPPTRKIKKPSQQREKSEVITLITIIIIVVLVLLIRFFMQGHTYIAETIYEIPAKPATTGEPITYTTAESGSYVIGKSPSEYATGEEKEFITEQKGTYVASEDFPIGTYDLVAEDGQGSISIGSGDATLSESMADDKSSSTYVEMYDNYTFNEGEVLNVAGVSVVLKAQQNDAMEILPGTYEISVFGGSGTVTTENGTSELNLEIEPDISESESQTYGSYTLTEDEVLTVSQAVIKLDGQLPDTPAQDARTITETVEFNPSTEQTTCKIDHQESACYLLEYYDVLIEEIEQQMTSSNNE